MLADLAAAGVVAIDGMRISGTAACRRTKTRIVVRLVRWDAPAWVPAANRQADAVPMLRDVERAALNAAPGVGAAPVTVKALARLAGYRCTGHFREAVRQLVDRGLLERVRGGVRRR